MSLKVNISPSATSPIEQSWNPQTQSLSLEAKVGQVIITHFQGKTANENAKTLIEKVGVGGIILYNFSNGLDSPGQVRALNESLIELSQKSPSKTPLLIAIDQEGGIVTRLNQTNGFTEFPGNKALGMTDDPNLAKKCAFAMGQEMRAVGINMNFAPVVDIDDSKLPVIGIRCFADTPQKVTEFAAKALSGYKKAHILTCLKHFTGLGNTTTDSHSSLPTVNKTLSELKNGELYPYYHLSQNADTIMTAHLMDLALDNKNCVTLSSKILNDILRKEIGFKGACNQGTDH